MYEMEGPRLAPRPWSPDCSGTERLAATTGVRFPLSAPVARPFLRRPWLPLDLNPSSVVRNFYCNHTRCTRPFRHLFKILLSSTGHLTFIPCAQNLSTGSCTGLSTLPVDYRACADARSTDCQRAQKLLRGRTVRLGTFLAPDESCQPCRQRPNPAAPTPGRRTSPTEPRPGTATAAGYAM